MTPTRATTWSTGTKFPQGDYDLSLGIDPTDPNVVYIGGTANGPQSGFIRVDTTGIEDPHSLVRYDNQHPDGGKLRGRHDRGPDALGPQQGHPLRLGPVT